MNNIIINYNESKTKDLLLTIIGGYVSLFGLYESVKLAIDKSYSLDFYLSLVALVLGVVLVLCGAIWNSKPIFKLDSEQLYVKMPNQKSTYTTPWINVKEVGIGISYLKLSETDGKIYTVDISGLKYSDLKIVKSQIIEYCESKNIPYRND